MKQHLREKASKLGWFSSGVLLGLGTLSVAMGAVPKNGRVTDDTAIYQNLSEIRVARERDLNFDPDFERLSALEDRYQEKLPSLANHPRLRGPVQRIGKQAYRYNGQRTFKAQRR
jgi:hypothetical protein